VIVGPQRLALAVGVTAALLALSAAADGPSPRAPDTDTPAPAVIPPTAATIDTALARGAQFLVTHQNPDGSWGSARRTKALNIYAPVPSAHHAFRTAVTALAVSALIEAGGEGKDVVGAIERGEAFLLANLPKVRRSAPRALYNIWAHAYGISALAAMHGRAAGDGKRQAEVLAQIARQIEFLKRYESINSGWGYYDLGLPTRRPSVGSMCFTTATVLVALDEARQVGAKVPRALIDRSVRSIQRQRNPDFSYLYDERFVHYRGKLICRPGGSLGRSQVCNLALRLWGDQRVTDEVLRTWLTRLDKRNGWLRRARKMPVPHESWFSVSGYFFYYGHYYAAGCIGQLPAAERPARRKTLAGLLLGLQETDGSWWDYPLYDYHQAYGTAMAMSTLHRCRR